MSKRGSIGYMLAGLGASLLGWPAVFLTAGVLLIVSALADRYIPNERSQ